MPQVFVDLVMDNGELVRIECPDQHHDDLYDSLNNAMKIGECWSPHRFDGCKAEYMGMSMGRINMKKVAGIL